MEKYHLLRGDVAYAEGVVLVWMGKGRDEGWRIRSFEDDTYYNGRIVQGIETDNPYIEYEEE